MTDDPRGLATASGKGGEGGEADLFEVRVLHRNFCLEDSIIDVSNRSSHPEQHDFPSKNIY